MDPLASADDVAVALGLDDASALSDSQALRVDGLLARVSRRFRREAERVFTPGTSTVRLLTVGGRVRLSELVVGVEDVTSVTLDDGSVPDFVLDGQELVLSLYGRKLWSGVPVTVTYTHSVDVPDDVVASVASIVGRHLTVDPGGAEAQSSELSTESYRQKFADWVSDRSLLTEEELCDARSYRYPGTAVIIQRP